MILVISGTIRKENNSVKVAREVVEHYRELGEEAELLDLQKLPAEAFLPGTFADKPETVKREFTDRVLHAEGLVVIVPEYNGSYPGILKHFVDLLPFPESFNCRPVAFVGLAAGYYGALRAVEQLQMVFAYRNAYLFNRRVFIPSIHRVLDEEGNLKDEDLIRRLKEQARLFRDFCRKIAELK